MNPTLRAHLALLTVALIYGANYSIAKVVLNGGYIGPLGFIILRVVGASLLFLMVYRIYIWEAIQPRDYFRLLLCSFFGVVLNQTFFFSGLKLTTPINASLIMTTTPILVLLLSVLIIKERLTFQKLLGVALGATGAVLLISYGQEIQFGKEQRLGNIMILVNALSYGAYLVLIKKLMDRYHPITIVTWIFILGIIGVVPLGYRELLQVDWSSFGPIIWAAVAYVIICTTFLAYLLNASALQQVNPSVVSIYIYLQPVIAALISLLLQQDQLNWIKLLSGGLIFVGVYFVSVRKRPN